MEDLQFILAYSIGNVSYEGVLLQYSPKGWNESIINRKRSDTYFSILQQFTTKLSFPNDGADILRNVFYNDGFEGNAELTIKQLDDLTQTYINIFIGNIDFSTFDDDAEFVSINISEKSLWETIKAKESVEYEIDIDTNNPITINADFPKLRQTEYFYVYEEDVYSYPDYQQGNHIFRHVVGVQSTSSEKYIDASQGLSTTVRPFSNFPVIATDAFFIANQDLTNVKVKFDLSGSVHIDTGNFANWILMITNYDGTFIHFFTIKTITQSVYTGMPIFISGEFLLNDLTVSRELYLTVFFDTLNNVIDPGQIPSNRTVKLEGTMEISYDCLPPSKQIKALYPATVLSQLLTKMNDGTYISFNPTFLTAIKDYLLTSGDAIRGLTGSKIKTSFKEFNENINKIFGTGFGFENDVAFLREKSYFYQNIEIANLGEVSNLEIKVYDTHIINNLKVGYEDQDIGDVNGKFDFNQFSNFLFPIKKIIKTAENISSYISSVYKIIFTSLNLEGKTTTDTTSDNETFIIHTTPTIDDKVVILNRDFNYINNFPDVDKCFNVSLSPKRCLLRNGDFINSFLHKIPQTKSIEFTSGNRNSAFSSRLLTEINILKENENILLSELSNPLFQPYLISFDSIIEKELNQIISNKQHGYFSFTYNGILLKGFINNTGINPSENTAGKFELISHIDNDLTQLING